jgi:hypothetical protein
MNLTTTPLLHPITDNTPLAALLNRWLVALAPAAALINPRRPSMARDCLQDVTTGAHFLHQLVAKMVSRLEAGKDLRCVARFINRHRSRPSLCSPFEEEKTGLALAMRCHDLHTRQQVYGLVGCYHPHLDKLLALSSPFAADYALLQQLLKGCTTAAWSYLEPLDEQMERADVLAILRCVLATDSEALANQLAAIKGRLSTCLV